MAFFGVNFILQKFCQCKKNDKYQVWGSPQECSKYQKQAKRKTILIHSYDHDDYDDLPRNTVQRIWLRVEKGAKNEAGATCQGLLSQEAAFQAK